MSDKKQTAVQYLEDIALKGYISPEDFERAKELFKKQIIDAYANGYIDGVARNKVPAEQYFNETYNK